MEDTVLAQAIRTVVQRAFPNCTIRNVSNKAGSNKGDNYLGVLHAITVELEDENFGFTTKHLVLKTSSMNEARKELADNFELFGKEAAFYMEVLPALMELQSGKPAEHQIIPAFVKCYDTLITNSGHNTKCDETSTCSHCIPVVPFDYILMDDLREVGGYRMASRFTGLDFEHSAMVLTELAKYHALSYAYLKSLKFHEELFIKFPILKESLLITHSLPILKQLWNSQAETGLTILKKKYSEDSPEFQKLKKLMSGLLQITAHLVAGSNDLTLDEMLTTPVDFTDVNLIGRERKERNQWLVLAHGDAWVNNFLFQYYGDKPIGVKMIDLQIVREICLTTDITYFFYSSTTPELRKEHLNTLLEIYFKKFMVVCGTLEVKPWEDFTLDNLKIKYKKAALYGASSGLCKIPILLLPSESAVDLDKESTVANAFGSVFTHALEENANLEQRLFSTAKECFDFGLFD